MGCRIESLDTEDGPVHMIMCGPGLGRRTKFNCQECLKREHTKLCDYRPAGSQKTCDKKLCDKCAVKVGKDIDYCPGHLKSRGER